RSVAWRPLPVNVYGAFLDAPGIAFVDELQSLAILAGDHRAHRRFLRRGAKTVQQECSLLRALGQAALELFEREFTSRLATEHRVGIFVALLTHRRRIGVHRLLGGHRAGLGVAAGPDEGQDDQSRPQPGERAGGAVRSGSRSRESAGGELAHASRAYHMPEKASPRPRGEWTRGVLGVVSSS